MLDGFTRGKVGIAFARKKGSSDIPVKTRRFKKPLGTQLFAYHVG
jgi:hypothetical protein